MLKERASFIVKIFPLLEAKIQKSDYLNERASWYFLIMRPKVRKFYQQVIIFIFSKGLFFNNI